MSVKRYEPFTDESSCDSCGEMAESPTGEYVRHEDYAKLEALYKHMTDSRDDWRDIAQRQESTAQD